MRATAFRLAAIICLFTVSCGDSTVQSTLKIYGGQDVTDGPVAKSVVSLRRGTHTFCSGLLVAKNVVATAGHCTGDSYMPEPNETRTDRQKKIEENLRSTVVAFGTNAVDGADVVSRPVTKFLPSPQWKDSIGRMAEIYFSLQESREPNFQDLAWLKGFTTRGEWHDIALVQFSGELPPGFEPAYLSEKTVTTREVLHLAGFGISEVGSRDSGKLKATTSFVQKVVPFRGEIVIDGQEGKGVCNGDSGGPAFRLEGKNVLLVGVLSRSTGGFCQNSDSIFTDVVTHWDWLKTSIEALSGSPLPTPIQDSSDISDFLNSEQERKCVKARDYAPSIRKAISSDVCYDVPSHEQTRCVSECLRLAKYNVQGDAPNLPPSPAPVQTARRFRAIYDTFLKVFPKAATELGEVQKCFVQKGTIIDVAEEGVEREAKHRKFTLIQGLPQCPNFVVGESVYLYEDHLAVY